MPGSRHRELGTIVATGLPTNDALKTETADVGVYFGTQSSSERSLPAGAPIWSSAPIRS